MKRSIRPNSRPPAFTYQASSSATRADLSLFGEQVALSKLAARHGTPLYVYSALVIRQRLSAFEAAFSKAPHTICYSVKANSNLAILRMLAKAGCGFDVVSGGELERVLHIDKRAARKVVFSGVGKTRDEMHAALKAGILLFNVESPSELQTLADCAAQARKSANIAVRVNPDVLAKTHPYISTGLHKHKFGIPINEARELYAQAAKAKFLRVSGVSVHIGSQIMDVQPFSEAMARVTALVRELRSDGHTIDYIDAGGGLGISYDNDDNPDFSKQVAQYAQALSHPLRGLKLHLLLEPGRSIIGPAGVLLTRVLYKKTNGGKKFLVADAGMNDLIRPSLYQAYHEIIPVALKHSAEQEIVDVVGPVCETGDFFARDRQMPEVTEGELLAILDAGAYGMALASNYNTRPRPAEVLVDRKSSKVIRRRETISDLIRNEI
ncbi:MAG TPA: diaminopimelate decarboxylase [Terriglobales bacterium]|nr:diaminopimelate decarboxylase [Terriglobales bacterium]